MDRVIDLFSKIFANPSDTIQALILMALFGTGILIALQLRATNKSIRLATIVPRMRSFNDITSSITEDEINSFLIHKSENFTDEIYRGYYEELETEEERINRIKSYIIMKKKYMYLLFCLEELEKHHYDFEKNSLDIWLRELMQYKEFRHLHERLGKYYPKFNKKINDIDEDKRENIINRGWMYKQSGELTTGQNDG